MFNDEQLGQLLALVAQGDDSNELVDNELLASALGWSDQAVADCLREARGRLLVWGTPGPRKPGPFFSDLVLTVQGTRFLRQRSSP